MPAPTGLVLLLFEQGKAGLRVFGDFVAFGEGVDGAFARLPGKEVEGDLMAALQLLVPLMEEIGFIGLFAFDAVSHNPGNGEC